MLKNQHKLNKLREWHPTLNFNNSIYTKSTEKIEVVCPIHGKFTRRYSDFSESSGCPICSRAKGNDKLKLTQEEFENKVYSINPDLDLSRAVYIDSNTPVTIVSPSRGEIEILPLSLFRGYGNKSKRLTQQDFITKVSTLHPEYDFSNTVYKGNAINVLKSLTAHAAP